MASITSIARPYALAAFEYAVKSQTLDAWKAMLSSASMVASEPAMAKLMARSAISSEQLLLLYSDVLKDQLNAERKNFLALLALNKRFALLPQIAELFHVYCAGLEKMRTVDVISAVDLSPEYQEQLKSALSKRMQSQITLNTAIDPSIIAGIIIKIGDRVIDGSVRGQLTRLLEFSLR